MQLQYLWPFLASRFPVVNHYTLFTISQPIFNQHKSANCSYESQPELLLQANFPQMPSQAQRYSRTPLIGRLSWGCIWRSEPSSRGSDKLPMLPPCSQREQRGGHHMLPCVPRILDCSVATSAVSDVLPQNPKPQTKCFCPVESALIILVWAPLLLTKLLPSIVPHQLCGLGASS